MKSPDEVDRLLTTCEATAEQLRGLNQHHHLLSYDFDAATTEEERQNLKNRFFQNFGPKTVTRESVGETVYIILSLDSLLCELVTAVTLEKMKRGLL